jgi:hypothetical protein
MHYNAVNKSAILISHMDPLGIYTQVSKHTHKMHNSTLHQTNIIQLAVGAIINIARRVCLAVLCASAVVDMQ